MAQVIELPFAIVNFLVSHRSLTISGHLTLPMQSFDIIGCDEEEKTRQQTTAEFPWHVEEENTQPSSH